MESLANGPIGLSVLVLAEAEDNFDLDHVTVQHHLVEVKLVWEDRLKAEFVTHILAQVSFVCNVYCS